MSAVLRRWRTGWLLLALLVGSGLGWTWAMPPDDLSPLWGAPWEGGRER